jgi:hypothetical protein
MAVIPEIDSRIASGKIVAVEKPFLLRQFQVIQTNHQSKFIQKVELNNEVRVIIRARSTRAIAQNEEVRLPDIDPKDCTLFPPHIYGKPAAFFLCLSTFLGFLIFFDFSPNLPDSGQSVPASFHKFPIEEYVHAAKFVTQNSPIKILERLAALNWPPAPSYYPTVLTQSLFTQDPLDPRALFEAIKNVYTPTYWESRLEFWKEIDLFVDRLPYLQKAVHEYFEGDYVSAIYVIVPHFEGAVKSYLKLCNIEPKYRFESCLRQLKDLIFSRKLIMYPKPFLEVIADYLHTGSFLRETEKVPDPSTSVNRHGIAHGVFTGFENQEIALKYLALIDGLAFLLMHDRLVSGTL